MTRVERQNGGIYEVLTWERDLTPPKHELHALWNTGAETLHFVCNFSDDAQQSCRDLLAALAR